MGGAPAMRGVAAAALIALLLVAPPAPAAGGALAETAVAQAGAGAGGQRRVLRVGPQRELRFPSQAARLAPDGDIIEIDPAI